MVAFRLVVITIIFSVLNLPPFSIKHHLSEMNVNLSSYYCVIHLISLPLVFVVYRRGVLSLRTFICTGIVLGAMIIFYGKPLLPFVTSKAVQPIAHSDGGHKPLRFRLLMANIHFGAPGTANRIRALVQEYQPEIVGLLETDRAWLRQLNIQQRYPYRWEAARSGQFGLALYTTFPASGEVVSTLGEGLPPLYVVRLLPTEDSSLSLALFHAFPPVGAEATANNYLLYRRLTSLMRHQQGSAIVFGDFNATIYSRYYKYLLGGAGMKNAAEGFGLYRTWNARTTIVRLAIDHVLYRGKLNIENFQVLPDIGSDHFPVLVDFLHRGAQAMHQAPTAVVE